MRSRGGFIQVCLSDLLEYVSLFDEKQSLFFGLDLMYGQVVHHTVVIDILDFELEISISG